MEEVILRQSIGKNQWPGQEYFKSRKSTDTDRMRKEGVSGAGGLTGTEAKALERGGCLPTCGGEPMVSGEGCGGAFSSQEAPTLK